MAPPEKDEEDEEFQPTGPAMDATGRLDGRTSPPSRARTTAPRPKAETLELAERAPRPQAEYVPPPEPPKPRLPSPGGGSRVLVALLVLAALGAAGWYFLLRPKEGPGRPRIAVVVLVTSEPSGAAVSVEGSPVGVTPWAADNTWGPGPVTVTVTHPGYRPWSGTFRGGRPARLEAQLQRR